MGRVLTPPSDNVVSVRSRTAGSRSPAVACRRVRRLGAGACQQPRRQLARSAPGRRGAPAARHRTPRRARAAPPIRSARARRRRARTVASVATQRRVPGRRHSTRTSLAGLPGKHGGRRDQAPPCSARSRERRQRLAGGASGRTLGRPFDLRGQPQDVLGRKRRARPGADASIRPASASRRSRAGDLEPVGRRLEREQRPGRAPTGRAGTTQDRQRRPRVRQEGVDEVGIELAAAFAAQDRQPPLRR